MENKITCECTHNITEGTMTISWLGGRVKLVCNRRTNTATVLVDDNVKVSERDVKVSDIIRLEQQCAQAAETLVKKEVRA